MNIRSSSYGSAVSVDEANLLDPVGKRVSLVVVSTSKAIVVNPGQLYGWDVHPSQASVQIEAIRRLLEDLRGPNQGNYFNLIDLASLKRDLPNIYTDFLRTTPPVDQMHRDAWDSVSKSSQLFELASAGHNLYNLFFSDNDLRAYMDNLGKGTLVEISWFRKVGGDSWIAQVPWGLMYQVDPSSRDEPDGPKVDPAFFLGLRYRLNYTCYEDNQWQRMSRALGSPNMLRSLYCLYWGQNPGNRLREQQDASSWQRREIPQSFPEPMPIIKPENNGGESLLNKRQVVDVLRVPEPDPTLLLYLFCCHARSDRFGFELDFDDTLNGRIIASDIRTPDLERRPIVFANACVTAADRDLRECALASTFFNRGCRSYIGTENKVPPKLASVFAFIVFSYMFSISSKAHPISLGEAFTQAKLFLWKKYMNIGGLYYSLLGDYYLYFNEFEEVKKFAKNRGYPYEVD